MAKKKNVTVNLRDLITQPQQLAHLPMINKVTGYRVLIAVLQRLQGLWRIAKMPGSEKNGQLYMNFITDEFEVKHQTEGVFNEGDVVFKLRLSDIADDPHYEEARTALYSITHINCFVPDKENPGYYITENLMKVHGRRENGKFIGTDFTVVIPRNIAENILDINLFGNYTRFVGYTAGRLRSTFSYPLYIYLSEEWRRQGERFTLKLADIRYRLGFVKDASDPDRETRYSSWSQFCQKVLDQAQKELRALAKKGGADFTFEYEGRLHGTPLPPYKRPDSVLFTILPTEAGRKMNIDNDYAAKSIAAKKIMYEYFHLTDGQCRKLLRRANPDVIADFLQQLQTWRDEIESGKRSGINSLPKWGYIAIDNFLPKESGLGFTPAEEVKSDGVGDGSGKPTGNAQPTANSQEPFNSSTGQLNSSTGQLVNSSTSSSFNALGDRLRFTPDEEQRLQAFKNDCKADATIPAAAFKSDIEPLQFHHTSPNGLFIVLYNPSGDKVTPGRLHYHSIYEQVLRHWHAHFPDHTLNFD